MSQRLLPLVFFFVVFGFFGAQECLAVSSMQNSDDFTRVFYYREGKNARTSFENNLNSIDVYYRGTTVQVPVFSEEG